MLLRILRIKHISILVILSVGSLALFCLSCATSSEGECLNPETLTFSVVPSEQGTMNKDYFAPILNHLANTTGKQIEFYMPTSNAAVLEAMISGHVDIARLGPYMYVISQEKAPDVVEIFGIYYMNEGITQPVGGGYYSVLITKKEGGLTTVGTLEGKLLALMDPGSTSGALVPEVLFTKMELNGTGLRDYFSKVFYTGGQDLSVLAVHEGRADAAFVSSQILDRVLRDKGWEDSFNFVWFSPLIPVDAWVYRANLCPEAKATIREAFFTFHEIEDSEDYFRHINASRFVPAQDGDYDIIRTLASQKE